MWILMLMTIAQVLFDMVCTYESYNPQVLFDGLRNVGILEYQFIDENLSSKSDLDNEVMAINCRGTPRFDY